MKIRELEQLNEATYPPMDIKIASGLKQLGKNIVANFQARTSNDPRIAGMSDDQKVQYFKTRPNVKKLADAAKSAWTQQYLNILSSNAAAGRGSTISKSEHKRALNNFIQKIMLPNIPMDSVERNSMTRINRAADAVVNAQVSGNDNAVDTAFDDLVSATSSALTAPSATAQQPQTPQQQQQQQTGAPKITGLGGQTLTYNFNTDQWETESGQAFSANAIKQALDKLGGQ